MSKLSPLLERCKNATARKKIIFGYSFIFAVMVALVYGFNFFINDRSLVWAADGLSQHCMSLAYYGDYLRTVLQTVFIDHSLDIPMFDFSIGFGGDIVGTLHYYAIGDPINLLSVFFSAEKTEYLYTFLVLFRMYVAGLTFSLYMNTKKSDVGAVVTGAVVYMFSGYCFYGGIRHPFFLTAMMYFPLVLMGIDRILEKKSPLLYITAIALTISANFYNAYMVCIFMVIYAAITYFFNYRKNGIGHFFGTVGKFALFTANAVLIPMIIFLPQIYNTLATNRAQVDNRFGIFYPITHYLKMADAFTNSSNVSCWLALGFGGITILALLAVVVRMKKYKVLTASLIVGIILMIFPVFGHIINGFSYVTNRWVWVIAFIAAAAVVFAYDDLFEMSDKEKKRLFVAAVIYSAVVIMIQMSRSEVSMMMLVVVFCGIAIAFAHDRVFKNVRNAKVVISLLVVFSSFMQSCYIFSYSEGAYVDEFMMTGDTYKYMVLDSASQAVKEYGDDSEFYRYDSYKSNVSNDCIVTDTNSTSFFFSVANPNISNFFQEIGLNMLFEQRIFNLDNRVILQYLTGTKYSVNNKDPFKGAYYRNTGFTYTVENRVGVTRNVDKVVYFKGASNSAGEREDSFRIYETTDYLPMGYTYDSVMSRAEYETLSPIEKQNVLLQTAVIDGEFNIDKAEVREDVVKYNVFDYASFTSGINIEGNSFIVTDADALIKFKVPVVGDSEFYLEAVEFEFEPYSSYDIYDKQIVNNIEAIAADGTGETEVDKISEKRLALKKFYEAAPEQVSVLTKSDITNNVNGFTYCTPAHAFTSGINTYAVPLGYVMPEEYYEDDISYNEITIKFGHVGKFTFESLNLCYQKLENIKNDVNARKSDILENVEIAESENNVKGTISLDESKILATQIPYSDGWTVYVDGEEAELLNVNTMFCGVLLDAGEHTVEFDYVTPYANIAVILSVIGTLQLIVTAIIFSRKSKKSAAEVTAEAADTTETE